MATTQLPDSVGIHTLQAYDRVKQDAHPATISDRTLWPLPEDWNQLTWYVDSDHEMVIASRPFDLGEGVRVRFLHRVDRTVELALIIDKKQTIERIRDKWSDLKMLALTNPMGMDSGIGLLRWTYVQLHEAGVGQTKLARQINEDILLALCLTLVEKQHDTPKRSGLSIAHSLMRALEIKDKQVIEEMFHALSDLRQRRLPWNVKQGPVSPRRVKQMVDHYRAKPETDEALLSWYRLIEGIRQQDSHRPPDELWQEAFAFRKKCTFFG